MRVRAVRAHIFLVACIPCNFARATYTHTHTHTKLCNAAEINLLFIVILVAVAATAAAAAAPTAPTAAVSCIVERCI